MLSSAFSNYLVVGDDGPLKLEELPDFTPGLVAINGPGGVRFLAATSSEAKLLFWPAHEASSNCSLGAGSKATELSLAGREPLPWRCMAGTLQPCEQAANQSYWCLLLAGWDGSRTLVAEMRMEDVCSLPDGPIRPSYSVPLEVDATPRSLTFVRRRGSLHLLGLLRSSIQAWDLEAKKALWRARALWAEDFKALSIAEVHKDTINSELFVVGLKPHGSRLLKARLP